MSPKLSIETLVTSQHPNELFRFMHLRNAQVPSEEQTQALFFGYEWKWASENTNSFMHKLQTMRNNWSPWSDVTTAAAAYSVSSDYIGEAWQLDNFAPKLLSVSRFLDKNMGNNLLPASLQTALPTLIWHTLPDFLADSDTRRIELTLWDNMAVYAILNDPNGRLVSVAKCLTALHLLKQLAVSANPSTADINTWYQAQIIMPDWAYELFARYESAQKAVADASFVATTPLAAATADEVDLSLPIFVQIEAALIEVRKKQAARFNDLSTTTQAKLVSLGCPSVEYNYQYAEKLLVQAAYESLQAVNIDLAYQKHDQQGILGTPPYQDNGENMPWKADFKSPLSFVQSAFIGDLHKTVSQLINFDLGEIAHIESVLKGETKRRTFSRLDRTEITNSTETDHSEEKELDTTTDDRFGMERETNAIISQQSNLSAGVSISAEYGVPSVGSISASAHLDYSQSNAQENSTREATQFSRQVTSRAVNRVKDSIRQSKTLRVIHEVKDETEHTIMNVSTDGVEVKHINGVYRYVDKIYLNRVLNYGKRLMLEFMIPEPANYFLFSKLNRPSKKPSLLPLAPNKVKGPDGKKLTTPHQLTDINYVFWAALYGATDVSAPPLQYRTVSVATNGTATAVPNWFSGKIEGLTVPIGYEATSAQLASIFSSSPINGNACYISVVFDAQTIIMTALPTNIALMNLTGDIAITYRAHTDFMGLNIVLHCQRTVELLDAWKVETFNKIMTAYTQRQKEVAEQEGSMDNLFGGVKLSGDNPPINREIERTELKRRVIELYSAQRFDSFRAAVSGSLTPYPHFPEILLDKSVKDGNIVKFFEESFEWKNATYTFYPYFWSRKEKWVQRQAFTDTDPIFQSFLQAGYARIVVPVSPGMERLALLFSWRPELALRTGASAVWALGIENPVHIALATELYHAHRIVKEEDAPIIDSYIEKLPTNLVYLAADLKAGELLSMPEIPKFSNLLAEVLQNTLPTD